MQSGIEKQAQKDNEFPPTTTAKVPPINTTKQQILRFGVQTLALGAPKNQVAPLLLDFNLKEWELQEHGVSPNFPRTILVCRPRADTI